MTGIAGTRNHRKSLALAACAAAYAPAVAASYGQMTLPGLGGVLLFAVLILYSVVVDVVLLLKAFRFRALVVVNTILFLGWVLLLWSARVDVAAYFRMLPYEWQASVQGVAMLLLAAIVLVPPIVQHFERGSRRGACAAIAVQCILLAVWWTYSYFNDHPLASTIAERKDLGTRGEQVVPGGITSLRSYFEQRHRWGTWESLALLNGVAKSAPIRGRAALGPDDSSALAQMLASDRTETRMKLAGVHYYPLIDAKLLWDSLVPGNVERSMPRDTYLPHDIWLEYLDRDGAPRVCSGNRLAEADRVALQRALTSLREPAVVARVNESLRRVNEACGAPQGG